MTGTARFSFGLMALAVLAATPSVHSDADAVRLEPAVQRYLDGDGGQRVITYRAFRRLEASGMGHEGWLEAWTELRNGTFQYYITGEGGSERVRKRVLRNVLEQEQHAWRSGEILRSELTTANYEFAASPADSSGLLKVLMKPRRKGKLMIEGAMFLDPSAAALVRVEGRAVSNPSFWLKRVDITRRYETINGLTVPVQVDTVANIRFTGKRATFQMTYQYAELNRAPALGTTVATSAAR